MSIGQYFEVGDVIRPHTQGLNGATPASTLFSVYGLVVGQDAVISQEQEAINQFNAKVQNNGSASIISEGPANWIDSVNRVSVGLVTVDYSILTNH